MEENLTPKLIRDSVKELGCPLYAGKAVMWILASIGCDSTDPKTVRKWMNEAASFDGAAKNLQKHGYLKDGVLDLPAEVFDRDPMSSAVALVLIGLEIEGLVVRKKE